MAKLSPAEEQALKLRVSIIASMAATTAGAFAMRDNALRLVFQQAALDITTIHWDRYKALYEALKSGGVMAAADAGPPVDVERLLGELVEQMVRALAP